MSRTPFKTPRALRTPRCDYKQQYDAREMSDSNESQTSSNSDNGPAYTNGEISLLAEFDDLMRYYHPLRTAVLEDQEYILGLVQHYEVLLTDYELLSNEHKRLKVVLEGKVKDCTELELQLFKARKLFDTEKQKTRNAKREKDELESQLELIRELISKEGGSSGRAFPENIRDKLPFLSGSNIHGDYEVTGKNGNVAHLSAIKEINSTGSILSDFSYSRSEDDLDSSHFEGGKPWKKHRPSTGGVAEPATKKRRSSTNKAVQIGSDDTVRATTTLTVSNHGPITATSVIESVPKTPTCSESTITNGGTCTNGGPPANLIFESWAKGSPLSSERAFNRREHCFQPKTMVMPETCNYCCKRIKFAKTVVKCKECKALCHVECKLNLPLPCIPQVNTPNQRNGQGVIGDYTPTTPPMVPAILIHCINEIELRGLNEVGLYRVPGAERDVKALKERFLKGKGAPSLNQVDVHVICGVVKDFLRGLNEPLVTYALWTKFANAADASDSLDVHPALYQIISELPQPNRDTLAYMILHLQKIAEARECKMGPDNLAKVLGPTIVGFSSEDPNANVILDEVVRNTKVMQELLKMPSDYWSIFVNVIEQPQSLKMQQTPSMDSLLRPLVSRGLFTPLRSGNNRTLTKKRQKYFPSPKNI